MADNTKNKNSQNTPAKADAKSEATPVNENTGYPEETNKNLNTDHGNTTIDDTVVAKIAGIAAREVSGVDSLGGGGARMLGSIRESFGGSEDVRQGVNVDVDEGTANIDVAINAEYGVAIHELAEAIRRNIINAVERMTGLNVEAVDVTVHDVKLPGEDDDDENDDQQAISQNQGR